LQGINNTYVFENGQTYKFGAPYEVLKQEYPQGGQVRLIHPSYNYEKIKWLYYLKREDYNFDKQEINLGLLVTTPRFTNNLPNEYWEYWYHNKYYHKYRNIRGELPNSITFPMSMENAKKLFGNKNDAFCKTFLTVKPSRGFFGSGSSPSITNFDILRITKKCFSDEMTDEPTLILDIKSTKSKPLN
jgi:hypothetical protein